MFRELIEKSVLIGESSYGENTQGVSNLSNLEPWGSSAIGVIAGYANIESHVRADIHPYGIVFKLGQNSFTNAKIYIPHANSTLYRDGDPSRLSCFYLRTSHGKNGSTTDRGETDYKSDWFKYMSTDYWTGIPLPWPAQWVPGGFLAMNGATFDKSRYPRLAQLYPSGRLPDLRGEFIRGWDANRGVDQGRGILSYQGDAIRNITGRVDTDNGWFFTNLVNAFYDPAEIYTNQQGQVTRAQISQAQGIPGNRKGYFGFDASRVVPTANENRPRNVAFQYICYAA